MRISVGALSCCWIASRGAREGYIVGFKACKTVTYTTNVLEFLSKTAFANLCLSISSTRLAVNKALAVL